MFVFRKEEQTKAGMTIMENWRWILDDNVHLLEFRHYRFEGMVGANYSNGQLKSDMGILEPGGIHFKIILVVSLVDQKSSQYLFLYREALSF